MAWFKNVIQVSSTIFKQSSFKCLTPPSLTQLLEFNRDYSVVSRVVGLNEMKRDQKPRVVVLGSVWAGCTPMKGMDTSIYDVVCVSLRNHMAFTPLLASTCVGTLEFRSVVEPIDQIQPAISNEPGSYFYLANCTHFDFDNHVVSCQNVIDRVDILEPWNFNISYEKLVIASVAQAMTLGSKGVMEHTIFLREVHHAQEILRKLLLNLMLFDVPGVTEEEKHRLLHCVVVGGGPTGVEFSDELSDFIMRDVHHIYAQIKDYIHVTLIEVAEHRGKYLASLLNRLGKDGRGHADSSKGTDLRDPFVYKHLGSMATVGRYNALVDFRESKAGKGLSLAGFTSWLIWHSAYLTRVVSWRNIFYVAINWLTTFIFGCDISWL